MWMLKEQQYVPAGPRDWGSWDLGGIRGMYSCLCPSGSSEEKKSGLQFQALPMQHV